MIIPQSQSSTCQRNPETMVLDEANLHLGSPETQAQVFRDWKLVVGFRFLVESEIVWFPKQHLDYPDVNQLGMIECLHTKLDQPLPRYLQDPESIHANSGMKAMKLMKLELHV